METKNLLFATEFSLFLGLKSLIYQQPCNKINCYSKDGPQLNPQQRRCLFCGGGKRAEWRRKAPDDAHEFKKVQCVGFQILEKLLEENQPTRAPRFERSYIIPLLLNYGSVCSQLLPEISPECAGDEGTA